MTRWTTNTKGKQKCRSQKFIAKRNRNLNRYFDEEKDHAYIKDQIIWAKLRGFQPWPAKVTEISGSIISVLFYGDKKTGKFSKMSIRPFQAYEPRTPSKFPLLFKKALEEAKDDFKLKNIESGTSEDLIMSLKHLAPVQISDTYSEYECLLKNTIQGNSAVPDWRIRPTLNFLLILSRLVTQEQQCVMYEKVVKLTDMNQTNLIWKILIPEWSIQIFMNKCKLSKDEAVAQLQKQEQAEIEKQTELDLLGPPGK